MKKSMEVMNVILSNCDKRRRHWVGALLACFMLAACDSVPDTEREIGDTGTLPLDFSAVIASNMLPQSRAEAIDSSAFRPRQEDYKIGMWICEPDAQEPFAPAMRGYDNMLASLMVGAKETGVHENKWNYIFDGSNHDILSVRRGYAVNIYAYYPYVAGVGKFDPTCVPFVSGEDDWMWAEPRSLTAAETQVDVASQPVEVPLRFHHAMTCIQVEIKCLYAGNVILTSMTLTDSEGRLYAKGSIDLMNGGKLTLSDVDKGNEITITPGSKLTTQYQTYCVMMPAIENYTDGELVLSFVFNGIDGREKFPLPDEMNDLNNPGTKVHIDKFERGTKYIYRLTLDNVMRFAPVGVDNTWKNEEIDLEL